MPADLPAVDLHALRVRLWLAQDNPTLAARWATAYQAGQAHPGPWPIYAGLALARVWAAQGETQKALARLHQIRQSAEAVDGRGWLIQALALEARLWASLQEDERAMSALDQALTLAEPAGYVRTFVDEGAPLARLLYRAVQAQVHPDYSRLIKTHTD
jgi:LuxR family maltose regulon positive regulatory protein